ncbi:hypothetical protein AB0P05_26630 [Streptomyces flaveolus]|uniref:hypothetical protein n=1 Tax=Streptomyces flaveolus TaxID=67297 RepID=UPI00342554D2
MTLNLKLGKTAVTFEYTHDNMTAAWAVKAEDGQDKLLSTMRKVIAFVEAQEGAPALPERIPGMALGMAQTAHPAPVDPDAPVPYTPTPTVGNWGQFAQQAPPELPADRQGDWEMIPPGEQG